MLMFLNLIIRNQFYWKYLITPLIDQATHTALAKLVNVFIISEGTFVMYYDI